MKNILIFLLLLSLAGLVLFERRVAVTGALLDGPLEMTLTQLFGMPVNIERLMVDPKTGEVSAERIVFHNQSKYSPRPHFDSKISFDIQFRDLLKKRVTIGTVTLTDLVYDIERIKTEKGGSSNVGDWVRHMRARKKKKAEEAAAEEKPQRGVAYAATPGPKSRWVVDIKKIEIRNDKSSIFIGLILIHRQSG